MTLVTLVWVTTRCDTGLVFESILHIKLERVLSLIPSGDSSLSQHHPTIGPSLYLLPQFVLEVSTMQLKSTLLTVALAACTKPALATIWLGKDSGNGAWGMLKPATQAISQASSGKLTTYAVAWRTDPCRNPAPSFVSPGGDTNFCGWPFSISGVGTLSAEGCGAGLWLVQKPSDSFYANCQWQDVQWQCGVHQYYVCG